MFSHIRCHAFRVRSRLKTRRAHSEHTRSWQYPSVAQFGRTTDSKSVCCRFKPCRWACGMEESRQEFRCRNGLMGSRSTEDGENMVRFLVLAKTFAAPVV
eukprot:scaffold2512_cov164-Amphora_coffeaeformis.AAC.13